MEHVRQTMTAVQAQVHRLQSTLVNLEPQRGQLRWFAKGRHRLALRLVFQEIQAILNHAAALTGYFDGYEARGSFQQRTAQELPIPNSGRLPVLFQHLRQVLEELDQVLETLLQRETLALAAAGPRKPGPERTLEVCALHLEHLEQTVCALVLNLASSKALLQRTQQHLES